jgi:hypothetical protein
MEFCYLRETNVLEGIMPTNLSEYGAFSHAVCLDSMQSGPLSPDFHLAEGRPSHSEPQSPQLTGNWQKREHTERSDVDEDRELHQLMEDIKSYIRSIDIGSL